MLEYKLTLQANNISITKLKDTMTTQTKTIHPYSQVLKWVADGEEIQGRGTNGEYRDIPTSGVLNAVQCGSHGSEYFQPNEFRIKPKPHIHQELMAAHEAGAIIQYQSGGCWFDCSLNSPVWAVSAKYRIKPQPKPDIKRYIHITPERAIDVHKHFPSCYLGAILEVTLDGETNAIKSSEVYKGLGND